MKFLGIKNTLPWQLLAVTILLCILPSLLNLFGLHFDLRLQPNVSANFNQLLLIEQKKQLYSFLSGKFIHVIFVTVSISIAIMSSILAFYDYSFKKNAGVPIIGIALLCAACLDILHLLITSRLIAFEQQASHYGVLTWFLSRSFHAFLLLLGISVFLTQKNSDYFRKEGRRLRFISFAAINLLLVAVVGVFFLAHNELKLEMVFPENFVTKPYDLVPLFFYLILGFIVLPKFCKKYPSKFSQTLLLSILPAIFVQIHMAFGSITEFDNHYMIAHFLRIFSYLIPLIGLILNYIDNFLSEKRAIKSLNTSLFEHKKTEDLMFSVLNSSQSAVYAYSIVRDEKNNIIDLKFDLVNSAAEKLANIPWQQLVGKSFLKTFPIKEITDLFEVYKEVAETGKAQNFEMNFDTKYGILWFQISAVKMAHEGVTVTVTNITESKNNEFQKNKNESLYRSLAGNIPDSAVFIIDKNLVFQLIDGVLIKELGLNKEDYLDQNIYTVMARERADLLVKYYQKALNGEKVEFEDQLGNMTFKNIFLPIKNTNNEVIFAMAVSTDITKKRKIEKALLNVERLAITGKITRAIAHEVRNPLTNINLAHLHLKNKNSEEDKNLYLDIILRNSDRINKLINEILHSSKTSEVTKEKCSIIDIMDEVEEIVIDRAILKQIKINKNYEQNLKQICVDIDKVKVAFINILINAKEAIEHTNGEINISIANINNKCVTKISDNGMGISHEKLATIFEPFYTDKPNGIGLGLITTQNIILSHQGDIDVESQLNKGTTFTITLDFCEN